MNAFQKFEVLPTYGDFKATLNWRVTAEFAGGLFVIRKSPDGINDWKEIGKGAALDNFVDTNLTTAGKLDTNYYQVTLLKGGKRYNSSVVGIFGTVKRDEFAYARAIMQREFEILRQHTPIKIYKLKIHASACPKCSDADTGQLLAVSLCAQCYGTGLDGGYWPAVDSFMQISKVSPTVKVDDQQGTGSEVPVFKEVRMIGYPLLAKGDMIIEVSPDDRYLVETIGVASLNAKIPLTQDVKLQLLPRKNIRYKF